MDLQFPHHENEIAQSEGAQRQAASPTYWMHNGFLNVDNEKMSKSLGNFFTIRDVLEALRRRDAALLHAARALPQPVQLQRRAPRRRARRAAPALHRARRACRRRDGRASTGPSRMPRRSGRDGRRLQHADRGGRAVRAGRRGQPQRARPQPPRCCKALGGTLGLLQQPPRGLPAGRQRARRGRDRRRASTRAPRPRRRATSPQADRIRDELLAARASC